MKICFFTYPSAFQNIGGGEIQLLKTKEYLEKEGAHVDLFDPWKTRLEEYDVLHVFSSVKDCLGLMRVAKSRGLRVVTSPVLWTDLRRSFHADGGWKERADLLARYTAKALFPSFPSDRRRVLDISDMLFPNSEAEKRQISRFFSIPSKKIFPVPNAVDEKFMSADPEVFRKNFGAQPFILSVGRIEPRKNQLNLIKAMKGLAGPRLVLIGDPVTGFENYYARCRQEGEGFVFFVPGMKHEDPSLASAYAACEVFVLQGWFETPGLAALEAGLAGARLAVTMGGSTKEYFGADACYLDPSNPKKIRGAIQKALATSKSLALKERILSLFTWKKVARRYIELYSRKIDE